MTNRPVFGHMHEDHSAELSLVTRLPVTRALVIASGGDLAFALAGAGVEVLAVDSNPAQIGLVKQKMADPDNALMLCFAGKVDRVLRWGGPVVAWLMDWPRLRPGRFRNFLTNTMGAFLGGAVILLHGRAAGRKLDRAAVRLLRHRLEKSLRRPGAMANPFLQVLLGNGFGAEVPAVWSASGIAQWKTALDRIELRSADIGKVLAGSAPGAFGLISVSNLADTMDDAAWDVLAGQAAQALSPGGYLIARSMLRETLVSKNDLLFKQESLASEDASPLCPVVWIGRRL
jgi:S-adenosylmethionine:diacylglycerol 3-amino-3-carboxypropyl transferase